MQIVKILSKIGLYLLFPFAILVDVITILLTVASVCTGDVDFIWYGVTGKLFRRLFGQKCTPFMNTSDSGIGLASSKDVQPGNFDWLRLVIWTMLAAVLVFAVCLLVL